MSPKNQQAWGSGAHNTAIPEIRRLLPVQPRTMVEQAAESIVAAAARGAFLPGDRLVEAEIARDLGISRVPVREALRLLRPGGVVAVDNALWHDRVADPSQRDEETVTVRELGRAVREDESLLPVLLPVGDGLLAARKLT